MSLKLDAEAEIQEVEPVSFEVNQFGDWTDLEWKEFIGSKRVEHSSANAAVGKKVEGEGTEVPIELAVDLPDVVDWRAKGVVGPVHNLGSCAAPWAWVATSTINSAWQIESGGDKMSFSSAQFNYCTEHEGNHPCGAGTVEACFEYGKKTPIETEKEYPWSEKSEKCTAEPWKIGMKLKDYKVVTNGDPIELSKAVAIGPVAAAIDASSSVFQMYRGGIISSGCGEAVDYEVLIVGYGPGYWLIQNSWGP